MSFRFNACVVGLAAVGVVDPFVVWMISRVLAA
jgi:hypothetical protein